MKNRNKEKRALQKSCAHERTKIEEKSFSNGTHHLEKRCVDCDKFFGYVPHNGPSKEDGETIQQINVLLESLGYLSWADRAWLCLWANMRTFPEWIRVLVSEKYSVFIGENGHE